MKEFRTTLDDRSARKVTRAAKRMGVTVPAYIRHILKETHDAKDEKELERQHREGYRRNPVTQDEFLIPDAEQVWPEW